MSQMDIENNPYLARIVGLFKNAAVRKANLEDNLTADSIDEYTKVKNEYIQNAIELLKLGVSSSVNEDILNLTIEDEVYAVKKIDLSKNMSAEDYKLFCGTDDTVEQSVVVSDIASDIEEFYKQMNKQIKNPAMMSWFVNPWLMMSDIDQRLRTIEGDKEHQLEESNLFKDKYETLKEEIQDKENAFINEKKNLEENVRRLIEEKRKIEERCNELGANNRELTAQKTNLENQNKNIEAQRNNLNSQKAALEGQNKNIEAQKNTLASQKAELEAKIIESSKELEKIKESLDKLSSTKEDLEKQLQSFKDRERNSQQEIQRLKADLENSKRNIENNNGELGSYKNKVAELEERISKIISESKDKTSELEKQSSSLDELTAQKDKLSKEKEYLDEQIEKLLEESNALKQENINAQNKNKELEEKNEELKTEKEELKAEKEELKAEKEELENKLNELEKQVGENRELIEQLNNLAYKDQKFKVWNSSAFNRDFAKLDKDDIILVMVSVKGLIDVNMASGKSTGDGMIRNVVAALTSNYNEESVYRVMGAQFAVIITDSGRSDVEQTMNSLKGQLGTYGINISYSCANGKACQSKDQIIQIAEQGLYGRNNSPFRPQSAMQAPGMGMMGGQPQQNAYMAPQPSYVPNSAPIPSTREIKPNVSADSDDDIISQYLS